MRSSVIQQKSRTSVDSLVGGPQPTQRIASGGPDSLLRMGGLWLRQPLEQM